MAEVERHGGWFSGMGVGGSGLVFVSRVLQKAVTAALTCIFALAGAFVGTITGAVTGQTREVGFIRGAGIGAVCGAILSMELLELSLGATSSTMTGIFGSLLNGKIFREWVSPAMLKAYQWQVSVVESTFGEVSDIFDLGGTNGMLPDSIKKLPEIDITHPETVDAHGENICCAVCLLDFKEGETGRRLPICSHFFHLECIDIWLVRHGSCPICRQLCFVH